MVQGDRRMCGDQRQRYVSFVCVWWEDRARRTVNSFQSIFFTHSLLHKPNIKSQGTLCAIATLFFPAYIPILLIGYVASLATKLSDTFASEIGKAYGRRTFLITTFKPVPPGTEGAVSLEGTLAGVVGSILIAGAGVGLKLMGWNAVPLVLIAAFVATNVESLLGASLQNEQHPWATNEFINFLNTLIGSLVSIGLAVLLRLPLAPA